MSAEHPLRASIVLRPRAADEVLDLAVFYLRHHGSAFFSMVGLCMIPPLILVVVLNQFESTAGYAMVASIGVSFTLETALTVFVGEHLFGRAISPWSALSRGMVGGWPFAIIPTLRWSPMYLPSLDPSIDPDGNLWFAALGGGALLLLVTTFTLHAKEVRLLEGGNWIRVLRRARDITRYRYGRCLVHHLIAGSVRGISVLAVTGGLESLLVALLQLEAVPAFLDPPALLLGFILAGPVIAAGRFFDYIDARTIDEGWDIQVRFQSMVQAAKEAEATE